MLIARNFEDPNYISGFLHNGWEVVCSPYFLHIPHRSRACSIYMKGKLKLVCKALTGPGANVFIPNSVGVHP